MEIILITLRLELCIFIAINCDSSVGKWSGRAFPSSAVVNNAVELIFTLHTP
jgi:hypothetical protein